MSKLKSVGRGAFIVLACGVFFFLLMVGYSEIRISELDVDENGYITDLLSQDYSDVEALISAANNHGESKIGIGGQSEITYIRIRYRCFDTDCSPEHLIVDTIVTNKFKVPFTDKHWYVAIEYGFDLLEGTYNAADFQSGRIAASELKDVVEKMPIESGVILQSAFETGHGFVQSHSEFALLLSWQGTMWNVSFYTEDDSISFVLDGSVGYIIE